MIGTHRARRRRPDRAGAADAARSLVPIALLAAAAVVRPLRPVVLVGLLAGVTVGSRRDTRVRWAWAAAVPVALSLCWGLLAPPLSGTIAACVDPASPPAAWRLAEAALVLASVALLAARLHATPGSLGLRLPSRSQLAIAIAGFLVGGPLAIVLGPVLAGPFFGTLGYAVPPGALAPALVFGLSNAATEEVAYRGALQGWTSRLIGPEAAILAQALVFGLAHGGPDVVAGAVPLAATLAAGGLVAGLIVRRTGSLAIPLAVHAALDLPIYLAFACPA